MSDPRSKQIDYSHHIVSSADQLFWAVEQIPTGRHYVRPLPAFGEWSVARILYHQLWLEERLILPCLQIWMGQPEPDYSSFVDDQEERDWRSDDLTMSELLDRLQNSRRRIIEVVGRLSDQDWTTERETIYGSVEPSWLVGLLVQSTLEQSSLLMQMSLYWDLYLIDLKNARLRARAEASDDQSEDVT
ncbi:MAG: DinB family protein [Chloroflexota bacterium]